MAFQVKFCDTLRLLIVCSQCITELCFGSLKLRPGGNNHSIWMKLQQPLENSVKLHILCVPQQHKTNKSHHYHHYYMLLPLSTVTNEHPLSLGITDMLMYLCVIYMIFSQNVFSKRSISIAEAIPQLLNI